MSTIYGKNTPFTTAYNRTLDELWQTPYESRYVQTRFGSTHILVNKPTKEATPVLLLHGAAFSSTMWFPNIAALGNKYSTYAIDIIGDKNKSTLELPFENRLEYAQWLDELMNELQIERAHIIGLSLGGMLAINFMLHFANRVDKAVIISPAESFVSFNKEFYTYAFGLQEPQGVERFLQWIYEERYELPDSFKEQFKEGMTDRTTQVRPRPGIFPYVYSDEELSGIEQKTLLLFGEHEVMYPASAALERGLRLLPNAEGTIIENAGHVLSMEQAEKVNQLILGFLG